MTTDSADTHSASFPGGRRASQRPRQNSTPPPRIAVAPGTMLKRVIAKIRFLSNHVRYKLIAGMNRSCELESWFQAYNTRAMSSLEQASMESATTVAYAICPRMVTLGESDFGAPKLSPSSIRVDHLVVSEHWNESTPYVVQQSYEIQFRTRLKQPGLAVPAETRLMLAFHSERAHW